METRTFYRDIGLIQAGNVKKEIVFGNEYIKTLWRRNGMADVKYEIIEELGVLSA